MLLVFYYAATENIQILPCCLGVWVGAPCALKGSGASAPGIMPSGPGASRQAWPELLLCLIGSVITILAERVWGCVLPVAGAHRPRTAPPLHLRLGLCSSLPTLVCLGPGSSPLPAISSFPGQRASIPIDTAQFLELQKEQEMEQTLQTPKPNRWSYEGQWRNGMGEAIIKGAAWWGRPEPRGAGHPPGVELHCPWRVVIGEQGVQNGACLWTCQQGDPGDRCWAMPAILGGSLSLEPAKGPSPGRLPRH